MPPAKTQQEWLDRLVNRFLRDMNQNLTVVNGLRTPQGKLYIQIGNDAAIGAANARMKDLRRCSAKLARVGPPPDADAPLDRIYDDFQRSCPYYERLADAVLKAVPLLSSGDQAKIAEGEKEFAKAGAPSRDAARYFAAAIDLLERNGLLARYEAP